MRCPASQSSPSQAAHAQVEALEPRRLLSAADVLPAQAPDFSLRVNFQPESHKTVPANHRADIGRAFGKRANKLSYGWSVSNERWARTRQSPASPTERHDTLNHFRNGAKWEVAVPNGNYYVKVLAGDPVYTDSNYRIAAEGVVVVSGRPSGTQKWVTGSAVVR